MSSTAMRTFTALALSVVVAGGVASCAPTPEPTPTQTAAVPSVTPTATPTESPSDEGAPITLGCDDLISPSVIYAFNPNTAIDESYRAPIDSPAATAVELGGIACSWVNQSSGDRFTISVAHPSSEELAEFESGASGSPRAQEYEGTFDGGDDAASTQAIVGPYWVSGSFEFFVEEGDVTPIMLEAIGSLEG